MLLFGEGSARKDFLAEGGVLQLPPEKTKKDFDRLFEGNLPFPSKYVLLFWGPLLRFLIIANDDYTKSSSTLSLEEVLFV